MTSNSETFHLKINSESAKAFLKIKLFDAAENLIQSSYSVLDIHLPKGLYVAKSEIDGVTGEELVIRLEKDIELNIKAPVFYSAALIEGYYTSHEYYTYPSIQESENIKTELVYSNSNKSGTLFLFYRFSSIEDLNNINVDFYKRLKLSIYDKNQKFLKSLDLSDATYNEQTGWISYTIKMPSGTYYLKDESELTQPLMTLVHVFKNKQTQYFCLLDFKTGLPSHNTARLFVSDNQFQHDSEEVKIIDILYLKLYKQDKHVGDFLIGQDFTKAPWNNPIIILQTLYLYTMGDKKEHNELFLNLIKHYQNHHVSHEIDSDLECIKMNEGIFSLKELNIAIPPPVLHFGVSILSNVSANRPGFISPKNIIHQISKKIIPDCVITTFKLDDLILLKGNEKSVSMSALSEYQSMAINEKLNNDWVTASMIEIIGSDKFKGNSMEAAKRLGVTDFTISNALKELSGMMVKKETQNTLKSFIETNLKHVSFNQFKKNMEKFKEKGEI
jgi:hypothetical protein